jgi:RNA 2',3'-cyclic 3'-phosphodiesterase
MPDRVRAFVALRMAPEVEQAIIAFIASMQRATQSSSSVRWVGRNNLHLTLRFLGDRVAGSTIERLDGALGEIASATTCFGIHVRGIGAFPDLERPRVVWVGVQSAELGVLASNIESAAVSAGLPRERRAFASHLTIARVRDLTGWNALRRTIEATADREFGRTDAKSLILYRSILGADSPTYEELGHYRLRAAPNERRV